ncbi:DUF3289 family protein [Chitinophaga polysaccharea]|uniref:DUF3289 family protein n=1 Tax=Chitinophaga TaxID=79328 RepID=UPI0014553157|nr:MULTISPECIES: DUF3289 family protein [Chitinophaga]NLR59157.1 DUF3289 family protein [Chitinophaga polysaccharea]NLU92073.1 DUF3289 family protein [Chitinophaga sp. Ak27]
MGDNKTGNMVVICKKYTENGENIRWNSQGETSLNSGKRIRMAGKQEGVTFHKNDPVVLNTATTIKVLKVTGPASVINGNTHEFKAIAFSETVPDHQLMLVNWAFSFDDGKTIIPFKSGTTKAEKGIAYKTITVAGNTVDKQVSVYAYFRKADPNVKATAKVIYLPLVVDVYRVPGLNETGLDIANDMAYGKGNGKKPVYSAADIAAYRNAYLDTGFDAAKHAKFANADPSDKGIYTTAQVLNTGTLMKLSNFSSDSMLFLDFRAMVELMARGDLNDNIRNMIDRFQSNKGGVYENAALTQAVVANPSTQRFCTGIEDEMADRIKKAGGELTAMEDKQVYYGDEAGYKSKHPYGHPAFPYSRDYNLATGLTIAINDVWSYKVTLTAFKLTGNTYKAKYEVQLWDHFGLDLPDMEKFYSYGAGFRAWFILQHLRGYKPFLTKVQFEKEFTGNITEGAAERKSKR